MTTNKDSDPSRSSVRLNIHGPTSNVKILANTERPSSDALNFLSTELGNDRTPFAHRSGTYPERSGDIRGCLEVVDNVLFEHVAHYTKVQRRMQPRYRNGVLTLVDMDKLSTVKARLLDAFEVAHKKGVTKSALARACHVSNAAVGKWLNSSKGTLTADNLEKAGRALGVRAEWLRTGQLPREREHGEEEHEVDQILALLEDLRVPIVALAAAMARLAPLSAKLKKSK